MNGSYFRVVGIVFSALVIAGLLGVSTSHAAGGSTNPVSAFPLSRHVPVHRGSVPQQPFSGTVEGTVFATSTTSITIDEKPYRGKNANANTTSTDAEMTFTLAPSVMIDADQAEYATSSMSDLSLGSWVSLVIERVGNNAGKVREIRIESSPMPSRHFH